MKDDEIKTCDCNRPLIPCVVHRCGLDNPKDNQNNKKTTCDLSICPPEDCLEDCPHYPKDNQDEIRKAFEYLERSIEGSYETIRSLEIYMTYKHRLDICIDMIKADASKVYHAYKSRDKQITELKGKLKVAVDALEDMVDQAIDMNEDCFYSYHAIEALSTIKDKES